MCQMPGEEPSSRLLAPSNSPPALVGQRPGAGAGTQPAKPRTGVTLVHNGIYTNPIFFPKGRGGFQLRPRCCLDPHAFSPSALVPSNSWPREATHRLPKKIPPADLTPSAICWSWRGGQEASRLPTVSDELRPRNLQGHSIRTKG